MRLNQFLAAAGLGSRRECDRIILEQQVAINGHFIKDLATQVRPEDRVTVNGKQVGVEESLTVMLHKPRGVICSTIDPEARNTVFDLLPKDFPRLFYVGRLDVDSEGLLLLTNQGGLAQRLTHPRFKLEKTYLVRLDKPFDFEKAPKLLKGFVIEPGFAKAEAVYRVSPLEIKIVLTQGLKRQIRLMLYKLGYEVKRLRRVQIGKLELGDLPPGQWRILSEQEVDRFLKTSAQETVSVKGRAATKKIHPSQTAFRSNALNRPVRRSSGE